jgi:hypothetical protein
MGCWYETCGLSGLPIPPDTNALLVVLGPGTSIDDGRSGFSYPTGQWRPLCLPFAGVYDDDQGTLKLRRAAAWHWDYTKEVLGPYRLVWRRDEDIAPPPRPLKLVWAREFLTRLERGWVTGTWYRPDLQTYGPVPIGQMLVRQGVWDALLGLTADGWDGPGQRQQGRVDAEAWYEYVRAHPELVDYGLGVKLQLHFEAQRSFFQRSLYSTGDAGVGTGIYRTVLTQQVYDQTVTREAALRLLYALNDLYQVNAAMAVLRRAWRPQPGKGSQDVAWRVHEAFHRAVAGLAATRAAADERDAAGEEDSPLTPVD